MSNAYSSNGACLYSSFFLVTDIATGVDHHSESIPDYSVENQVDQNSSGGGMVSPHNNVASGSRVQDFPMLPPPTGEEMDSESDDAQASDHVTPAAELSNTAADDFPLGVPMAEDKIIPSRRVYETAFVLIGHPKTSKKNRITTSPPQPTKFAKSNPCQRPPPFAEDTSALTPVLPPRTPPLSPRPKLQDDDSPPVSPRSIPSPPNLSPTKLSGENELESIVEDFRKLKVSDSNNPFAMHRSLDWSHSTSLSDEDDDDDDEDDALAYFSSDSTSGSPDQPSFNSEDLIQISGVDPVHSTPVSNAVAAYRKRHPELWEELESLGGSFPVLGPHAATTTTPFDALKLKFQDPIWAMKCVQSPPRGKHLAIEKVNSEPGLPLSTDMEPSSSIKEGPQSLPDVLLSPLMLEKKMDYRAWPESVLFGKDYEYLLHTSPELLGRRIIKPIPAKYRHKLPKHQPPIPVPVARTRPRSSDPFISFMSYVPKSGFRTPSPFPSSCRTPGKPNSFDSPRHGSFEEMYTTPPASEHRDEPVASPLVWVVEDVPVKDEVNAYSKRASLKGMAVPEIFPVVEEPEPNALDHEAVIHPIDERDNPPGLFFNAHIRPLGTGICRVCSRRSGFSCLSCLWF
ncbi:hypothetical protein M413DRAFT_27041 [Hebeloma cylindrosporum]|uniref:Uncharacterized protein n=1 Tax=Hebeloma cylindrosporum TaxID=76867 RepID=A0A0C3C051_HEBCY|nr:hypothetical protein M413DRAFT_27041 [Hebeloma cylindrosporum h7]